MESRGGEGVVFLEELFELLVHRERRTAADVGRDDAALEEDALLEGDDLLDVLADVVQDRQDEVVRFDRARAVVTPTTEKARNDALIKAFLAHKRELSCSPLSLKCPIASLHMTKIARVSPSNSAASIASRKA